MHNVQLKVGSVFILSTYPVSVLGTSLLAILKYIVVCFRLWLPDCAAEIQN